MVILKSPEELALMREGGRILREALAEVVRAVRPGISAKDLDRIAERAIRSKGGEPSFLGYKDYPASLCVSIGNEVVHGIPKEGRVLQNGDIVGLDLGVRYPPAGGYCTDKAVTVGVGLIDLKASHLLAVTTQALEEAIKLVRPGATIHDIARVIQHTVESSEYSIVRALVGHGVGKAVHEDPQVPNYVSGQFPNIKLEPGLVIAIEPMVAAGEGHVEWLSDGWTVVTVDGSLAAHFEETVAVTQSGHEVLTR